MRLAELRPASHLAQLKPERLVPPKIRKAFPDTAFWAADMVTDATGHARAKVEFPDSLTTWRATARGITADTKVGSATSQDHRAQEPDPAVGRAALLRAGRRSHDFRAGAQLSDRCEDSACFARRAGAGHHRRRAAAMCRFPAAAKPRWIGECARKQVSSATVTGKALTNEESDALEMQLPVNIPGVKMAQAQGGSMRSGRHRGVRS